MLMWTSYTTLQTKIVIRAAFTKIVTKWAIERPNLQLYLFSFSMYLLLLPPVLFASGPAPDLGGSNTNRCLNLSYDIRQTDTPTKFKCQGKTFQYFCLYNFEVFFLNEGKENGFDDPNLQNLGLKHLSVSGWWSGWRSVSDPSLC